MNISDGLVSENLNQSSQEVRFFLDPILRYGFPAMGMISLVMVVMTGNSGGFFIVFLGALCLARLDRPLIAMDAEGIQLQHMFSLTKTQYSWANIQGLVMDYPGELALELKSGHTQKVYMIGLSRQQRTRVAQEARHLLAQSRGALDQ